MSPIKCVRERRFCLFWFPISDINMVHEQMKGTCIRHEEEGRRKDREYHFEEMLHPNSPKQLIPPVYFCGAAFCMLLDDTFGLAIRIASDEFDIVAEGQRPPLRKRF